MRLALGLAVSAALLHSSPGRALEVVVAVGEHGVIGTQEKPLEGVLALRLTGAEIWRSKGGMVLMPAFGVLTTEDNAVYGWAGGALQIPLSQHWGLVPEVGVGSYHQGEGRNLGGSLEFRSGLEVTYRAHDAVRVGVGFYHISNAGFHEINPGVNSLVLTFGLRPKPRSRVWDTAGLP